MMLTDDGVDHEFPKRQSAAYFHPDVHVEPMVFHESTRLSEDEVAQSRAPGLHTTRFQSFEMVSLRSECTASSLSQHVEQVAPHDYIERSTGGGVGKTL